MMPDGIWYRPLNVPRIIEVLKFQSTTTAFPDNPTNEPVPSGLPVIFKLEAEVA